MNGDHTIKAAECTIPPVELSPVYIIIIMSTYHSAVYSLQFSHTFMSDLKLPSENQ